MPFGRKFKHTSVRGHKSQNCVGGGGRGDKIHTPLQKSERGID